MASAIGALQKAAYTALNAYAPLMTLVTRVSDRIPQDQPFPHVKLGYFTEMPWNVFGRKGKQLTMTIHAYSVYLGNDQLWSIKGALDVVLDHPTQPLVLDGYTFVDSAIEFTDIQEEEQEVRHLIVRYRVLIEE